MSTAFCSREHRFFCSGCAAGREAVHESFWAWTYYFAYRSPWSGELEPALDRLEFEGRHSLRQARGEEAARRAVSKEKYLVRYPDRSYSRPSKGVTDEDVRANWNVNAERWDALYDDDGDRNRKYASDEPMLHLLGDVGGLRVLDIGSGNGYLCRKLARAGAAMTGVELSDRFFEMATGREAEDKLGITYHHGSVAEMGFLPDSYFDKAVSNYVLMDVLDYTNALTEVSRVLQPGGRFVVVLSHPSIHSFRSGWVRPAPDSPRRDESAGWLTDLYFRRGPLLVQWGDFDPVLSFHRPLRDYWEAFAEAGFTVDGFEEPSITERGRRELPVAWVEHVSRIPYSCIFRLIKPEKG